MALVKFLHKEERETRKIDWGHLIFSSDDPNQFQIGFLIKTRYFPCALNIVEL
nr:MAG TPA: hypothetical protein [Ackermannviridae sp.]